MAEATKLVLQNDQATLGEIVMAPEVLEIITGIAASKVPGVYQMRGSLSSGVSELFGKKDHGKGVRLSMDQEGLSLDVYCYLTYGVAVPKIALEIQETVKEQVLFMTDIEVKEVNVHVVGVIPEKISENDGEEA